MWRIYTWLYRVLAVVVVVAVVVGAGVWLGVLELSTPDEIGDGPMQRDDPTTAAVDGVQLSVEEVRETDRVTLTRQGRDPIVADGGRTLLAIKLNITVTGTETKYLPSYSPIDSDINVENGDTRAQREVTTRDDIVVDGDRLTPLESTLTPEQQLEAEPGDTVEGWIVVSIAEAYDPSDVQVVSRWQDNELKLSLEPLFSDK